MNQMAGAKDNAYPLYLLAQVKALLWLGQKKKKKFRKFCIVQKKVQQLCINCTGGSFIHSGHDVMSR